MDLVSYRSSSIVTLRILSPRIIPLHVHWIGRTMVCAGQGKSPCPACKLSSPKLMYYGIGKARRGEVATGVGLLELSAAVVSQLVVEGLDVPNPLGWTFRMTKRTDALGWLVTVAQQSQEERPSGLSIFEGIETLYGLQRILREPGKGDGSETVTEWLRSQRDRIEARLAFACQNGSHQLA